MKRRVIRWMALLIKAEDLEKYLKFVASKEKDKLTKEYLDNATPAQLHEFHFINEENIGSIPKEFNSLVGYYDLKGAKALHYTNGGPWFDSYKDTEASEEWWRVYNSL